MRHTVQNAHNRTLFAFNLSLPSMFLAIGFVSMLVAFVSSARISCCQGCFPNVPSLLPLLFPLPSLGLQPGTLAGNSGFLYVWLEGAACCLLYRSLLLIAHGSAPIKSKRPVFSRRTLQLVHAPPLSTERLSRKPALSIPLPCSPEWAWGRTTRPAS